MSTKGSVMVEEKEWHPTLIYLRDLFGFREVHDFQTLFLVSVYWILFCGLWINYERVSMVLFVPLLLLTALFSFVCATATHNTMHLSMFKREYVLRNYIWQHILSLSYGHPVSSYVPGHNLSHHMHTQKLKDHMRTSKVQYKWNFMNLLMFQPTVAMAMLKGDFRYLFLQKKRGKSVFYQAVREYIVVFGVTLILLYAAPVKTILLWYIPHLFAQWAIVGVNVPQHDGCEVLTYGVKGGNDTRNFTDDFENFIFMNNGYHGAHHIRPQLHWSKLKAYHDEHVGPNIHPNLNRGTLSKYLFETYVYPGKRVMYDGREYFVDPLSQGEDEEWLTIPKGIDPEDITFEKAVKAVLGTALFFTLKIAMPMYSPIYKII
eukprot:TRINITY_DN764_c0_g2_i1.p2 TRINITY_DN764_c0_g2~~TRINITY_DN764_c0_g2_i1.p2  ORF type:complete len:391 (+),score=68.24 TRINITY_DN764_c0_g2_i1:54-1175(+)